MSRHLVQLNMSVYADFVQMRQVPNIHVLIELFHSSRTYIPRQKANSTSHVSPWRPQPALPVPASQHFLSLVEFIPVYEVPDGLSYCSTEIMRSTDAELTCNKYFIRCHAVYLMYYTPPPPFFYSVSIIQCYKRVYVFTNRVEKNCGSLSDAID